MRPPPSISLPRLAGPSARAMLLQGISIAIGFFSGAALARALGADGRGQYQLVALAYGLSAPLLNMGIPSMLTGRPRSESMPRAALLLPLATAWAVGAVLTLFLSISPPVRVAMALLMIGPLVSPYTEVALYRRGMGGTVQALRIVDVGLTGLGVIVLALGDHLSAITATLCLFGSTVVVRLTVLGGLLVSRRSVDASRVPTHPAPVRFRLAATRFWGWECVVAASAFADTLIAAFALPRADLGIYAVAAGLARISSAGFAATAPLVVSGAVTGESARRLGRRFSILPVALGLVAVGVVTTFGGSLISLIYGEEFRPAAAPASLLIFATLVAGVTSHVEALGLGAPDRLNSPRPRLIGGGFLIALTVPLFLWGHLTVTTLAALTAAAAIASMLLTVRQVRTRRVVE